MYTLKYVPEDFMVKEISLVRPKGEGKYLYFLLRKRNLNTMEAVQSIARILHLQEKQIGFAGSKDKQAITEQVCSIFGAAKERLGQLQMPGMRVTFLGYGNAPISLGDLQGNHFEIVVRNLEPDEFPQKIFLIPNYFDEQRFGKENIVFGKHLIKKQFAEAVAVLKNKECEEYLLTHPHDYIGALKLLPLRLLRLYLNAYQSYLWNETLTTFLLSAKISFWEVPYSLGTFVFPKEKNFSEEKFFQELKIPLIGFDYNRVLEDEALREIIQEIMNSESISPEDFILKQIPQLTLEGEMRKAFVEVKELAIGNVEEDEFHPGKRKVKVSFTLPKGSYATMVVRGMMVK